MEKIILASNSPRRREILGKFIEFEVKTHEINEIKDEEYPPQITVMGLAYEKGISVAEENIDSIVISSDTIVEYDGKLLGKPKDRDEAKDMIKSLSGKTHNVYTAYAIFKISENIKYVDYEKSEVKFYEFSNVDIEKYLDTNEYADKAGAYGIQGYGALLVEKINGDYFNIMGLPIAKLSRDLKRLFGISLW
ncbi:septum formation protein Maf [Peptoniphilus sp. MSJ-1]|uniref:dTTP/UTP pyrophosphatase n=1 Tax=Peptoniphilus ovalis TaxID=2841503 RepID=A0ABS6FID3_9FIRM|nr:Maf family protein [Peptoniphilus ovalis]MBU5669193.1 septum formation protein Maf [Peptoniphilus ovalis]